MVNIFSPPFVAFDYTLYSLISQFLFCIIHDYFKYFIDKIHFKVYNIYRK
nr:MAG TPA: hypothetical protein [Bacteriophage sp.]